MWSPTAVNTLGIKIGFTPKIFWTIRTPKLKNRDKRLQKAVFGRKNKKK
jgi:hypothetical protein